MSTQIVDASATIKSVSERTLAKYIDSFSPILISRKARKNYSQEKPIETHPMMSVGTGIYVSYRTKIWMITANHVITKVETEYGSAPLYVRHLGAYHELFKSSKSLPIIQFREEDLAVIPLHQDASLNYDKSCFIDLNLIPAIDLEKQLRIGIYGYLNKEHKSVGNEINPAQFLSRVGTKTIDHSKSCINIEFSRRDFEGDVADGTFIPQPNGLSGGPVFSLGSAATLLRNKNQTGTLCGLFQRQNDIGKHGNAYFASLETIKACIEQCPI